MTAMTRSASTSPLSIRSDSPDASETLSMATLCTAMGSGMTGFSFVSAGSAVLDDGADRRVGRGHGVADARQRRDDRAGAPVLHEPHGRLDLRSHAAAG